MPGNSNRKTAPVGCLLVHGFTGSPNELLELGAFLESRDVVVSIPTLPGHATHSADLFNYTWRDWFECVKAAHDDLSRICKQVFVCGLSMGGTLALHLAAHRPVQGVVTLSAPVHFPRWQQWSVRVLKYVRRYRYKRSGEDVMQQAAKAKLGSYRRYPYAAVEQLFRLVNHVREDLPEITQPILIVHSRRDHTVAFANASIIYQSVGSQDKRRVDLERSYHVVTVDVDQERVQAEVFEFFKQHSDFFGMKSARKASGKKVEM